MRDVKAAVYLTREEAGVTEGIFFVNPKEVWADINDKRYDAVFELLPEETIDKSIVWSSSDTAIAEVDETGTVIMKRTGEVTIDATLNTGAHSSFVPHVYDPVMVEKSLSGHMIEEVAIISKMYNNNRTENHMIISVSREIRKDRIDHGLSVIR